MSLADDTQATCLAATDPGTKFLCQWQGYPVQSDVQGCVDAANTFTQPLDDKVNDIAANWQPLTNFDSGQIRGIVGAVLSVIQQAQSAVDQATQQPNANQSDLANATDELARHGGQATDYLTAANQADAAQTSVAAPHIKQWVLNAMNSASSAMVAAYVVGCTTPWWVGALAAYQTAFDIAWGIVKSIAGIAATIGKAAIVAAEGAATGILWSAKLVGWLIKYWPFIGIAIVAGGVFLIFKHRDRIPGLRRLPRMEKLEEIEA